MMVKLYDNFSEKNMRMSRDLEGTEVSPVIWGELYDLVGRFSKSLMAPSDYRGGNDVFDFQTKNRLEFEPCMVCIILHLQHIRLKCNRLTSLLGMFDLFSMSAK
ncbi:unnamed protein product [Staurois parvus]|uniref:Uncharacterized protein n=1 Tax=Staurois parvus TaxID=386267 RepID=A0ABN9F8I5_9NEOB|nr:unnamed protein product [Staurois parvus]